MKRAFREGDEGRELEPPESEKDREARVEAFKAELERAGRFSEELRKCPRCGYLKP